MQRVGSGYFGSSDLIISTANQEILQQYKPANYKTSFSAYKFSFMNLQDCHVVINGSPSQIYLKANTGFEIDSGDKEIYTFVIVEASVSCYCIGAY